MPTPESHQALISGLLRAQGYKRVGVSAALNTGQSILELCGSYVVLALVQSPSASRLASLGAISLASAALATILGAKALFVAKFGCCSCSTSPQMSLHCHLQCHMARILVVLCYIC